MAKQLGDTSPSARTLLIGDAALTLPAGSYLDGAPATPTHRDVGEHGRAAWTGRPDGPMRLRGAAGPR
jgi:hypothetical protein